MKQAGAGLSLVGVMMLAAAPNATAQGGGGRAIRGTVYDSLDARPLSAARVMLLDRSDSTAPPRSVSADSLGRFAFTGVAGGMYLLGFEHPLVDSLGIALAPRGIQLADIGKEPLMVQLAVPGARTVHDAFCGRQSRKDSSSVLIGHLAIASTRGVVANGAVTAQWLAVERKGRAIKTAWPTASASSRPDGSYVLCGLPAGTQVAVQARAQSDASAVINIITPARTGVIRRELYLMDPEAARAGVVTGLVLAAASKQPVPRAQVRVAGDATIATTDDAGRFALHDVPFGTVSVDARSLGYIPQELDVDVLPDAPARVSFAMKSVANMLDTVRTYADVNDANGFNDRRKKGWGKFFDSNDIARIRAWDVNDIARGVPGVQVTGLGFHAQILMRRLFPPPLTCVPTYYLDGAQLTGIVESQDLENYVQPHELSGVEVYANPIDAPPQFRPMWPTCGTVLLWTFRSGHGESKK